MARIGGMYKSTVIQYFGSISELARFLNIKWESINGWKDVIPKGRAYELLVRTGGALSLDISLYSSDESNSSKS